MGLISISAISDGETIDATDVNTPLNTIVDDYNGNIDSNNLASNAVTTVKITDANKGGLMTEIGGIQGFLPVSQLSPTNYPRVSGGDKEEILTRLRKFVGQEMAVKVINCDKEGNKLIFSEKAVKALEVKEKIDKYAVGDKLKGRITGIVDFGLFVSLDPQVEGLVHISEVSWGRVTDLSKILIRENEKATADQG